MAIRYGGMLDSTYLRLLAPMFISILMLNLSEDRPTDGTDQLHGCDTVSRSTEGPTNMGLILLRVRGRI